MPLFQNMSIRDAILDCLPLREPLKCEIGPMGERIAMCVGRLGAICPFWEFMGV